MGHSYSNNGRIKNFWPDDIEGNTIYLDGSASLSLSHIIEKAKEAFGASIDFDDIEISTEYIHTSCLGYDLYDSSDYTCFIVITYSP
jgi:hypothetical protein